jgi:hypothetical protein
MPAGLHGQVDHGVPAAPLARVCGRLDRSRLFMQNPARRRLQLHAGSLYRHAGRCACSVDRRVIESLVELAGSFGARCPHGFSLEIRLTQQDIADLVGASRPVVSSILSGLRKRGLLNYTRDMICVNDSALSLVARSLDTGPKGVSSI